MGLLVNNIKSKIRMLLHNFVGSFFNVQLASVEFKTYESAE